MFRPKPPGPAGLPPSNSAPSLGGTPPKRTRARKRRSGGRYEQLNLPWWVLTGWLVVVMASALLALRPMNELIGRQPATILWLIAVLLGTFFYREWLAEGRLERIDAGWIGAPGRVWRRIHDRYEHVFLTLTGLHVAMIFCGVLYGIASTGPVARAIVIGFVVLAVPLTVWATIQARRDLRERARTLAERELRYQRRANVRSVDDFAR